MSAGGSGQNLLEVRGLTKIFGTLKACDESILRSARARSTRCSARTAPASPHWSRCCSVRSNLIPARYSLERQAREDRQPERRQEARHRHGLPALFAVRGALRGGEHRTLAQRPDADLHHCRQGAGAVLQLRSAARPLFAGWRPFGWRAPAHRDHPLPAADARSHHPRRADLRADAAGGRQDCSRRWSGCARRASRSSTSRIASKR